LQAAPGFRSGRGTFDAVFLVRRIIEKAMAVKDQRLVLLALDWAKAFDSIAPESLCHSLRRFGLPAQFLRCIEAIYTSRRFSVSDGGQQSSLHNQNYGICQGCPLSPFLFGMVMTVLITDAKKLLETSGVRLSTRTLVNEILYADDTLLIDADPGNVETYMQCVRRAGSVYGLTFNWKKLELVSPTDIPSIYAPTGDEIKPKKQTVYLGCIITADGTAGSELNRRIGGAREEFEKLRRVWAHSGISRGRKLEIFDACIASKLLYNLHSLWLSAAEVRKIDAFQNRCLRRILKIPPSFYSHVTNATVLQQANAKSMSGMLLERQLKWMGALARRDKSDIVRQSVFDSNSLSFQPRAPAGPRRRGRPKVSWATGVFKHAKAIAGSIDNLNILLGRASKHAWEDAVYEYCHNGGHSFPY